MHTFVFPPFHFELWPSNSNELWMRTLIFLLIMAVGLEAERVHRVKLRIEKQKREVFDATMHSTQHVLNNLMNQMQLVFVEAEGGTGLSEETLAVLRNAIIESRDQVRKLGELRELDADSIEHAVDPD